MTAFTCYGSSVAATTVTTANKLSTTTGGTETSKQTTILSGTSVYLELLSQGGAGSTNASIPSPSGKGWLLDATTLEGQTIASGNWSAKIQLDDSGAPSWTPASLVIRFYKRSSGGTYTSIGSITINNPTVSGTKTLYTFSATSMSSVDFATGDKLYTDLFIQSAASPNNFQNDFFNVYLSNSGTAGVANDLEITTPGYSATSTSVKWRLSDGYGGVFS